MIAAITNFLQIDPNLGTAGQPTRKQFPAIRDAGYEVVINLLPPESEAYLPEEEQVVRGLGMEYISIPVVWTAPTRQNLEHFFAAMDQHRARKVFAHCMMNMRVTAFVFLYRALRERVPVAEARRKMEPVWEPNPVWAQFIEERLSTDDTD